MVYLFVIRDDVFGESFAGQGAIGAFPIGEDIETQQ